MRRFGKSKLVLAAIAAGLIVSAAPAQAGIFEQLFGGLSHALRAPERLPDSVRDFAPPFEPGSERAANPDAERDPSKAFCVRTCDGQFFPVVAHPGLSVAQACSTFCPASQTRVYSGGRIDDAVTQDGSRYTDLPRAFLYRKQSVAGCTCNGRDQFGLTRIDVNSDPTLKAGDVVATPRGMVAFTGRNGATAKFTPARGEAAAMRVASPGARTVAPLKLPVAETTGATPRSAQR
jgi:hypothetical protein